jgi:thiol-disulfide isomerase/thioredoxin
VRLKLLKISGLLLAFLALPGGLLAAQDSVPELSYTLTPMEPPVAAPGFTLDDMDGKSHSLSDYRGKWVLINFWATWCPPCRKEIPEFIALQKQYAANGLQFIGIAIDDQDAVEDYLASIKINYPMLIGGISGIALAHQLGNNIDAVPFTLIVDRKGQIIHRHPGEFSREQITEIITPLITDVMQ